MPVTPEAVAAYLRLPSPSADADLLGSVCAAVNGWVGRLDWVADAAAATDPPGTWPPTAEHGAVMLAARMFRRRNTPAGVEALTDLVVYVPRRDSDVDQLLRVGAYQMPGLGEPVDTIGQATAQVVGALVAAGIDATADNRDFNPPGVYVAAPGVVWDRLAGYTLTFDLWVAVPNMGRLDALTVLGPLVEATRAVWAGTAAFPVDLIVPDSTDPLPAYRLPITVQVTDL